jgi:hypothetical protein
MYEAFYAGVYNSIAKKDTFQGGTSDAGAVIAAAIAVLVLIVVQLLVVQFLWNAVLVPSVSVVRPLKSLLQTLGLLILFALIVPGSVVVA